MPAARAEGLIAPGWAPPPGVRALATTRWGGASRAPFDTFNLALHVGDDDAAVLANRQRLASVAGLDAARVQWLDQRHGRGVLAATSATTATAVTADAAWTAEADLALAILVADCVPVLLASSDGALVAAAHCGWRGTLAGVVEATVRALPAATDELAAWLGPGICQRCYQVGDDVRDALAPHERRSVLVRDESAGAAGGKWLMDLPGLVARRLFACGVGRVAASGLCSRHDPRFFSLRGASDPLRRTGRLAAMAWRERGR